MSAPDKRLWAKVSVDYFDNPKIEFLTDSAQLLHLQLILKAKAQGRGGMLAERACKVRGAAPFKELVDAGLLDRKGLRSGQSTTTRSTKRSPKTSPKIGPPQGSREPRQTPREQTRLRRGLHPLQNRR
ncbi:hypothetical protein SAMN04489745_0047 [Arthrobacter woluwensis]|uniref:Uncharacterized protein n=1 Tax=Arthrobacter woluwensis TaxID=156980 RepID=A0A1H4I5N5_9MICC|nr:hypothetical protein SAMN04489745_0047 [Arthrobacter woluwensis]